MGQLPDHEAAGAELRQQGIFTRQPPMLRDVLDFQEQARRIMSDDDLSNGAVEYAVDSARRGPGQFALNDALAARPGALEESDQAFGAARKIDETPAERLIGAQTQQRLTCGIQVVDVQVLIEKKDAGDQRLEQVGPVEGGPLHLEFSSQAALPRRLRQGSRFSVLRRQLGWLSDIEGDAVRSLRLAGHGVRDGRRDLVGAAR